LLRLATVVCFIALQGCTLGPDTELELRVDSSDPAIVAGTARVLAARFKEFPATLFSSTEYAIQGSTIRFTFKNGAPEPKVLAYLYETPGHLRAALATNRLGRPSFTEQDVRDVAVGYRDSMPVLRVVLTAEAGQRLVRLTSENIGQIMTMTLDGETLTQARIQGVFGERFEVGAPDSDLDFYRALRAILTTGALPARVTAVEEI
jgi:preprotein translocase subunit SecD